MEEEATAGPATQATHAEDDPMSWEIEKMEMERVQHDLNSQVADMSQRIEQLSQYNDQLTADLQKTAADNRENGDRARVLEVARNELTDKNLELESTVARLKISVEERDAVAAAARREAQAAQQEKFTLKDEVEKLTGEKLQLTRSAETLQQERKTIEFERQKYTAEREAFAESKRWMMQELAERDNNVSKLRLQLSSKDVEAANEKLGLERNARILSSQIEGLNDRIKTLEFNNSELLKRLENAELSRLAEVSNLEKEVRCQTELQRVMKCAMEEAKLAADQFKSELEAQDNVLAEARKVLLETQEDWKRVSAAHEVAMKEKDEELAHTRAELAKVNETIKTMSDVKLNVSEEELAGLAPAAAETVRYLRGGESLSTLVLDHARVCGKLRETEEENESLRTTLEELIEAIRENKPFLLNQRQSADELGVKTARFEEQMKLAEAERLELLGQRDSAQRELAYAKAELEKYQRDFDFVTKRNAQLQFAVERQNHMQGSNWSDQEDEQLFMNIAQLQKRNMELESDIENAKASAAQAAINAQSEEMAQLRAELAVTKKSEEALKTKVEQTREAFESLKTKTEHFKELIKDSVSAEEARGARVRAEEAKAAQARAEAAQERLKIQAEGYKEKYEQAKQEGVERLQSSESNMKNLTELNIKLEVALDAQKANVEATVKEYEKFVKERDEAKAELQKVALADEEKGRKLADLTRVSLEATDKAAGLEVRVRAMNDDALNAAREIGFLKAQIESLRGIAAKEEQLRESVVDLAKAAAMFNSDTMSQNTIQQLRVECDSWKSTATRYQDLMTHTKNEAKLIQQRLERELEVARSRWAEKEDQVGRNDIELNELRSNLASVKKELIASKMSPGLLKEEFTKLKIRAKCLETELDEAKAKLMEAKATQSRMDDEQSRIATHNNLLEVNLKQSEEMGSVERERLTANAKFFEERSQQLAEELTKCQTELLELQNKLDEQRSSSESETIELQRQLHVASQNLDTARRELELANSTIVSLRNEASRNATALEEHTSIVRQFEDRVAELENGRIRLQAELNNTAVALEAEKTAKHQADGLKDYAESQLKEKTEQLEKLTAESMKKEDEHQQNLSSLTLQYESLSTTVVPQSESSDNPDSGFPSLNSVQQLLQYLRQSKDEMTLRAMNACAESSRLRAETREYERLYMEMVQKVRDLETEKIATSASLVEKAQLIEQVQTLTTVHNLNTQLNEEKAKLQAQLAQLQKEKAEIGKQISLLTAKNNDQNLKIAASTQELLQRKKEIDQLKQRNQARGPAPGVQAQMDQMRNQLLAARQEASAASEKCKAAETAKAELDKKHSEVVDKFNQTRRLAIKYRDENTELKKIMEETDPTARISAQVSLQTKAYAAEIEQLKTQIKEQTEEIENMKMTTMRLGVLEKSLTSANSKLDEMTRQNALLTETNKRLSQMQSTSATDSPQKPGPSSAQPDQTTSQKPSVVPLFGSKRTFGVPSSQSPNIVPPAPAPTNLSQLQQPRTSPVKRPVPPSIPNEPMDIIPPVPSDNIPVVPDPTPPTTKITFGSMLPVPHTFQSSARVPTQSLFTSSSTTTVQPQSSEKKNILPNIDSAPSTPGGNGTNSLVTTTSSLASGQPLFGSSGAAPTTTTTTTSADTMALPEESVVEGAAGQSSLVSGSVDQQKVIDVELVANDSESRDSTTVGGVSSSDGRRKRGASGFELSEAKRQRDSPNEAVTSSETRQQSNLAEIPELDDDDGVLGIEHEVSDEDPNDVTLQERRQEVIDLENDEEVLEDEMEGEEEDDDSFGNDDELEAEGVHVEEIEDDDEDDVVVLSDDDDQEGNDAESLNDADNDVEEIEMVEEVNNDDIDEVLGGEDSQPSLEDQDREAASAVEEADEEERDPLGAIDEPSAPADPTGAGIGSSGRAIRLPTGLREAEREDQCSSSNETAEERPEGGRLTARNLARLQRPTRGAKPYRGVYTPGRGGRGRGGAGGTA